jgi:hypothetical protein
VAASSSRQRSNSFSKLWPWFFLTAAFESLFAIISLLLIPSEGGISIPRLAVLGILFLLFITGLFFGFRARKDAASFDSLASSLSITAATLLSVISGLTLFLLRYLNPERLLPYYERISPLLWVVLAVSIQAVIFFNLVKNGFHSETLSSYKSVYSAALFAFCVLLSIFIFVAVTRIGITPDSGYWGEPGVAIQGWQFILSILAGALIYVWVSNSSPSYSRLTNLIFPIAVYLIAAALWPSVPNKVLESSFYSPIDPPAEMPFPYSDAGFYDYLAQSLLIGTNYLNGIPPRPFYVLFLGILHFFFGQNYPVIIAAQTLALAFFPVSLYFLAKKLHSPSAGVTVTLFAIFRELVGLWISSNTRVANSKILTTDFPTAMAISFVCLILLWWLEKRDFKSTLVAGGSFGLLLLFRTQSLFILPAVFILAWFVFQRKTKNWIFAGIIFALAMLVTVMPWLTHNYTVSGKFSFDDPRQVAIIYSQYSASGNLDLSQFDPEKDSVGQRMISFTLENPAYVARFISTHILNTEIGGLLSLPLIVDFESLIAPINLYWVGWDGSLEWYNSLLLLVYLTVIAIGLGVSWKRMRWLGLLPLAFNLGYTLANGISRFSAWRYNLPVDWVIYFYFGIGVIEMISIIAALFGKQNSEPDMKSGNLPLAKPEISIRDFRFQYSFILLAFAFIGGLPWLAKGLAQPHYTSTQEQLILKLEASGYSSNEINSFLSQSEVVLMEGRLLYPRMYSRGRGISSANPWPAYAVRDFPRLGFLVLNDQHYNIIFPTQELLNFQQGADVVMLGCQREDYIEARLVDISGKTYQSIPLTQPCK